MGYNLIQKALMKIGHLTPRREVWRSVNEEVIEKDKKIKELVRNKASLEHQLSIFEAEKNEQKEKEKTEDLSQNIAEDLNNQEKEITSERFGEWFSWTKLERKLYINKKFKNNFLITDKDGVSDWNYGELVFSTKGFIGIKSQEGKLLNVTKLIGLIHKPESIFNQYKLGKIQLAVDKNGNYIDGIDDEGDINDYETSVPIYNEKTKKYNKASLLKKNAREMIIKLQEEKRDLQKENTSISMAFASLQNSYEECRRALEIAIHTTNNGKSLVTEALEMQNSISAASASTQKRITILQEKEVINEKEISMLRSILDKLLDRLDDVGDRTARDWAMAQLKGDIEFLNANTKAITSSDKKEKIESKP